MKTILKASTTLGALAGLMLMTSGCAEFYKKTYDWSDAKGTEFTKALANEYYQFGQSEENIMYDDLEAAYFMKKANKVQDGCPIMPEYLDGWKLPNHTVPELQAARDRLIFAMQNGAQTIAPQMTAKAQANYDCWVEQQEENWQFDDIKLCRDTYYMSIDAVEKLVFGSMLQAPPAEVIEFATDSAALDAKAMEIIDEAVIFASSTEFGRRIHLIGHTDASGSNKLDKKLSHERVMAVKQELEKRGIPASMITTEAAGKMKGKKHEADHRRVDILFLEYK
ncbi:OmpA family domain protein [Candidatus Bealeia paramacronuclearis]|uniref:OmpA family domain protein n=1 Tax=Candidatus Bealeia paramacronuclearis TaxID=1921001 RepID=A0ABZ2C5T1_9PROT|nr:OmpA family domain protein [Candidatus Bealeia paramacronuclearis]